MICSSCGEDSSIYSCRSKNGKRVIVCRSCKSGKVRPSVFNPFCDLYLDHVRTPEDRPVHVTSLRQLRDIEKQHKCISAVANMDDSHVNEPPQHKPGSAFNAMSDEGRWLHPEIAESMIREMRESGELA